MRRLPCRHALGSAKTNDYERDNDPVSPRADMPPDARWRKKLGDDLRVGTAIALLVPLHAKIL